MKIKLNELINALSKEYFNGEKLRVYASFPEYDIPKDVSREKDIREYLNVKYIEEFSSKLTIGIYHKNESVAEFIAYRTTSSTDDLYKTMSLGRHIDCIGPGFYYYPSKLFISNLNEEDKETKETYRKVANRIYIDDENTDILSLGESLRGRLKLRDLVKEYGVNAGEGETL